MQEIYPAPPYRQNDLFTGGRESRLNACVGRNGGPYGLDSYAMGYFKAAQRLAESLVENWYDIDLVVYPLVFAYRHGLELALKDLVRSLPELWDESASVRYTHRLLDNWATVRSYLERRKEFDPDGTLIPMVDKVIKDMVEIDETGEAFRFPEARSGSRFLQDISLINVEVFATTLGAVGRAFAYWRTTYDAIWEAERANCPDI